MTDGSLLAFVGIAAIIIVTPGQDTALTIRNSLLGGRSGGIATAAGVAVGQACWTLAASLGLTALLIASQPAFAAVRYLGAAYLVYLGAHSLWSAIRSRTRQGDERRSVGAPALQPPKALRQGVLSNLGNPKMAVFFSSLLPQFVPAGSAAFGTMLGLGLLFVSMTLSWLLLYAVVVSRAGDLLRRPRARRALDAISGALLVAFGLRLASEPS